MTIFLKECWKTFLAELVSTDAIHSEHLSKAAKRLVDCIEGEPVTNLSAEGSPWATCPICETSRDLSYYPLCPKCRPQPEVLACPFCGITPTKHVEYSDFIFHSPNGCVLSNSGMPLTKWNSRAKETKLC